MPHQNVPLKKASIQMGSIKSGQAKSQIRGKNIIPTKFITSIDFDFTQSIILPQSI